MVYVALTPQGARDAVEACVAGGHALWIASDCLLDADVAAARSRGVRITTFSALPAGVGDQPLESALETIELHHPSELIWVERRVERID